jgi:S-adenosylmethionine:tRNA ribosyltransferase-isomerase
MKTGDFDYHLPPELIAQIPVEPRDRSRLMIANREDGSVRHNTFADLADYLRDGDVLVFNDSRVIPARLRARKASGGMLEVLLVQRLDEKLWETLVKPARRAGTGTEVEIIGNSSGNGQNAKVKAQVVGAGENGTRLVRFSDETLLSTLGKIPLPPYIHEHLAEAERYQTVYAREPGSIAAPTAGLHFTAPLLERIKKKGVQCLFVTLQIGLDTFQPVRHEDPLEHSIHREYGIITPEVAVAISKAKAEGRRIIAVGTTTVRLVEAAADGTGPAQIPPFEGWVDLFILPGYRFRVFDAMITNFHLPRSTLLMLVSAFAGRRLVYKAYQEAIARKYRFYSFGDAMVIL